MLKKFFNYNERQLNKYRKTVLKINSYDFSSLSDDSFVEKTNKFKNDLSSGKSKLNDILPEAYALVKEASKRVLNKEHYDVQLIGGIALHQGNVAEMKTGEGKTLVATLPAYLNALSGGSVHIVTVNEYLAKRDFEELSPLYSFLGISSSYIDSDMSFLEKKEAYKANIIFGTNNEFGFDYLRDNMISDSQYKVQSHLDFAIIDEVDSILIDESRTPLVISGPSAEKSNLLTSTNALVKLMKKDEDYEIDNETQQVYLTENGIAKSEAFFQIDNLYAPDKIRVIHFLNQSLKANVIMKKDKDYIVSNGEIHIIDEFTGRISKGRRFSNNLHQALEVKENVEMKEETTTKATITYQNYFRLYNKISGMTGTAETEKEELKEVYGLDTIVIPTNKPILRVDNDDLIFATKEDKYNAIARKIIELYDKQQPVLIGTTTIEESEELSHLFKKLNISHVVLNAKNHEKEADIIANAGLKGSVTIATNMAGRGTDIKLGEGVPDIGGLYVLGTSKNENRRVDNQLRGRSGRQGDPGESQFYVSLEDDLMVRFGANKAKAVMDRFNLYEEGGISSPILTKVFANAQKQLEGANYEIRKRLLKYDDILRIQRNLVYSERNTLLGKTSLQETLYDLIKRAIDNMVENIIGEQDNPEDWDLEKLAASMQSLLQERMEVSSLRNISTKDDLILEFKEIMKRKFEATINDIPKEISDEILRNISISCLDQLWERHLEQLDDIRQGIHLYAYSQTDPFREYQVRAKDAFENMLIQFTYDVSVIVMGIKIKKEAE